MGKRFLGLALCVGTAFTLLACSTTDLVRDMLGRLELTPTPGTGSGSVTEWYVAPGGDDSNSCSEPTLPCLTIQAAIEKAGDGDDIQIEPGTYRERAPGIAAGLFIEDKTVSLSGSGEGSTFVEAEFPAHTALVLRNANATIARLTIQGGREDSGGGIAAGNSALQLRDVSIQDNEGRGLIVTDSRSTFDFMNLTLKRNDGSNSVEGEGVISASRILENGDTGLINGATLTISDTLVEGNHGGNGAGILNSSGGILTIERSTVSGNVAANTTFGLGLGIRNEGSLTLINSTVSNNQAIAGGSGSAIVSGGDLTLIYSTIADNRGSGIISYGGTVTFENTLLGNNDAADCAITRSTNAFRGVSLDSDETCTRWDHPDRSARDIGIGPLADNGGQTPTHALLGDSLALDAATGDCPAVDQRGEPRSVGLACDVGAFEASASALSAEGTPDLAIATATSAPVPPTVTSDTLCWKGPGAGYEVVSSVGVGSEVMVLGRGIQGGWWVIDNPRYPGVRCWMPEEDLEVDPLYPVPATIFDIPPLPTPTPPLGCRYQGPNDPDDICYPIDQCPVPFEDSEGACVP